MTYQNNYSSSDYFRLEQENLMFAFGIEDQISYQGLNDDYFVRWKPQLEEIKNGKIYLYDLGFHICTPEDYSKFWSDTYDNPEYF